MSEPSKPAGTPDPRPRAAYGNPSMRISDAERAEVSDRLSQHYSDGRLDEAEFSKRLDQAMHAVTQSDLHGLFDDLPDGAAGHGGAADGGRPAADRASRRAGGPEWPGTGPACRSGRPVTRLLKLAVLIVVAVVVGHALMNLFLPAVLIAVVALVWLRRGPGRRHRHSSPEA
jgi:Domain of unknown function (DUF1707)